MKAYTQILCAIARSGPLADAYKRPYEVSTTYSSVTPEIAFCHTLWRESPPDCLGITREHVEALTEAIKRDGFKKVLWIRVKKGKVRTVTM